jgi:hypothetical protein
MKRTVTIIMILFAFFSLSSAQITIDGNMEDWQESMHFDIAPNSIEGLGDSIDVDWDGVLDGIINPALDIKDIYVSHDANYLYVRLDINEDGTFSDLESMVGAGYQASLELFLDTDVDTSTGLTWGWWLTSGDYWVNLSVKRGWPDFQVSADYGILKFVGANGSDSQWQEVEGGACTVAVNLDDNKMEIAIPREVIGEINNENESTGIILLGEDPTAGWNADIIPNDLGGTPSVYYYNNITSVEDNNISPTKFTLEQNYPNPFNPSTTIQFSLVESSIVNLKVYNILGQEVASLISSEVKNAGIHKINFNANKLSSGIYIYRIQAGNQIISKKMMLLK